MSLSGTIKSYNALKEFGFISSESGDVFFRMMNLPEDCKSLHGNFLGGRDVRYDATTNQEDGRSRASNVFLLGTPGVPFEQEYHPGMVKSYSDQKGFGFIVSSLLDNGQEVMFGKKELVSIPPEARSSMNNMLIVFKAQASQDGRLRATDVQLQDGKSEKVQQAANLFGAPQAVMMQQQWQSAAPRTAPTSMSEGAVMGTVKSFSERHGYGFISAPGMADARFQTRDVDPSEVAALQAGASVQFMPLSTSMGRVQAREVRLADGGGVVATVPQPAVSGVKRPSPNGTPQPMMKQQKVETSFQQAGTGAVSAGSVKTFNPMKGFGFITSEEFQGDAFFMQKDIQGADSVQQGQAVHFELLVGDNGKYRAQSILPLTM